jgi:hypothetical protein
MQVVFFLFAIFRQVRQVLSVYFVTIQVPPCRPKAGS